MKTYPVYEPIAIALIWPLLLEGYERILKHSHGDVTLEWLYNELLAGRLMLWVGYDDQKLVAFTVCQYVVVPFGKPYLKVLQAYIKAGTDKAMWTTGMEVVEKYAKEKGCSCISMYTEREEAFEKKLSPLGWTKGYTEYRKEVL